MDLAYLITAVGGVLAIVSGFLISRKGQQETHHEQSIADQVAHDRARLEETQQALDTYVGLVGVLRDESARLSSIAEGIRDDLSDERREHATDSAAYGLIEQRCRQQSSTLVEALNVLQTVVVNESAQALIRRTRGQLTIHPHDPAAPFPQVNP